MTILTNSRSVDDESGRLFALQPKLSRLPVPSLAATLDKYAVSLEPLLAPDELAQSKRIIGVFGRSAQAQELQRRLEARAAEPERASWLEEWWNALSYMGYRDPVIPYTSYHYSFTDDPSCSRATQRAAKLIDGAIAFRQMVVDGTLEPEMQRDQPLCSHSYKFMFNACRIPKVPLDYCRTVKYAGNETVVVARNSQFFVFSFIRADGTRLSVGEIEDTLARIVEAADKSSAVPVGIMTADNRDSWANNRELLSKAAFENAKLLDEIESAAFLVSLEKSRPETREELSHAIWHGNGHNRWFDKPCQFIVCDNARAGFSGEHSMMDGTPTLRLVEYVIAHARTLSPANTDTAAAGHRPAFRKCGFHTPAPVAAAVEKAEAVFKKETAQQHVRLLNFDTFGKEEIKCLGCSPDAFIQMAIQLAYSRLHGCARPTYESSMTRRFLHGRTETCRSVSSESVAWCASMAAGSAASDADRMALFRRALARHTQLVREATMGCGVDRHLLGLRMLVRPGEPMPAIFEDPAYAYSSHWFLSTSQVSSENFASYGWSEVSPKGYGIAYNIRKECLLVHIACMRNEHCLNSDDFADRLASALAEMRAFVSRVSPLPSRAS
ncbi:Carnitine O-acetyltransferase mitochondrial [Coemansia sp. RSA 552]|nr:Carnitine O-acetyltransferase mitochondrial [Coemansia sp. RSA 552]